MIPEDCRYTEEHEWIRAEGTVATVGITAHAAEQLGDVTYVDLPTPGMAYEQGQTLGAVESVKAVSDVYAPAAGKVLEINDRLDDEPGLINSDPYGEGWICKLELSAPDEMSRLMDAGAYKAIVESQ